MISSSSTPAMEDEEAGIVADRGFDPGGPSGAADDDDDDDDDGASSLGRFISASTIDASTLTLRPGRSLR